MKEEPASQAWNRFATVVEGNQRTNVGSKNHIATIGKAFQYVGVTRIRYGELPPDMLRRIKENILRGYTTSRQDNMILWMQMILRDYPGDPVRVGYICRQHMHFSINATANEARNFFESLQALCGVTGKVQAGYMKLAPMQERQWYGISGRASWRRDADAGPRFAEVRAFVEEHMKLTRAKRQLVVDWLNTGPEVTHTFKAKFKET